MLNFSEKFWNSLRKTESANKRDGTAAIYRSKLPFIIVLGISFVFFTRVSVFTSTFSEQIPEWTGLGKRVAEISTEEPFLDPKLLNTPQENVKKIVTTHKIQSAKTLWDWLGLFLAPATIVGLGYIFQNTQEKAKLDKQAAEQKLVEDQQREQALQNYFDKLTTLLVEMKLTKSQAKVPQDEGAATEKATELEVIKARTLALFRLFDNSEDMARKASVLSFLGDSGLLEKLQSTNFNLEGSHWGRSNLRRANLSKAKLRKADFSGANLSKTHLDEANLSKANFSEANLSGSSLSKAKLFKANLSGANLYKADLSNANLSNADLSGANLSKANLSNANLSNANLNKAILLATNLRIDASMLKELLEGEQAPLLCNVSLPPGIAVVPDRDCDCLAQMLLDKYPQQFANLKEAQAVVNESRQKKWD
jgi:uncharacterized protein YjbI with pentapeptide repeats